MERIKAYLHAVDIPWESSTAECARNIQRRVSDVALGEKTPEACVELAIKLSRVAWTGSGYEEEHAAASVSASERLLVFHLFNGSRDCVSEGVKVGKGTFSHVFRGTLNGQTIAMKKFSQSSVNRLDTELIRELAVLHTLHHPNVVELLAWTMSSSEVSIILPLFCGNLRDFLRCDSEMMKGRINLCAKEMVLALSHCHARHVLHRDVKPDNILVRQQGDEYSFSLCDFNLARFFDFERTYTQQVVTLWYRPPELTLASVPVSYSTGVDGWALGCVLYEILLDRPAFDVVEESIGRVHLHFFTPSDYCFCRGCKASRVVSSLKGSNGFAVECITSLLQRAHERTTVSTIAARHEETVSKQEEVEEGSTDEETASETVAPDTSVKRSIFEDNDYIDLV